jgi:hypothetical protein
MIATTTNTATLYLALELGQDKWLLACATQAAEKPRFRSLPARDLTRLQEERAKAKRGVGLPALAGLGIRMWWWTPGPSKSTAAASTPRATRWTRPSS